MIKENDELKSGIQRRLRRIEGQLRGIQRMVDEGACCNDVIIQITAIRAAISKVGVLILENHVHDCLYKTLDDDANDKEQALNSLANVINNFVK